MSFRILCITPWFPNTPHDGIFNFIYHSVDGVRKAGNQVTTLVTRPWIPKLFGLILPEWNRPPLQSKLFDPDLNIHIKHYFSIPRNYFYEFAGPLYQLGTAGTIKKLIRDNDIQIIHAHTEAVGFAAVPIARELGLPVVITIHGINTAPRLLNTKKKKENLRNVLSNADRVILVGEPLRAYFAPLTGRDDHFRIVPNGFYLPGNSAKDKPLKFASGFRIVSVSNLHEGKGIELNIKALSLLGEKGFRNWTYQIIGDGSERQKLEQLAAKLNLLDKIKFTGRLPHDKALSVLGEGNIFLLPSYREAFGVAYLEAMATGLLTVGVEGQGPEAFIAHGKTGFLVPPRDADAICRLLRWIIEKPYEAEQIAAAGCEHIHMNFTWDEHAKTLMSVYRELIRDKP